MTEEQHDFSHLDRGGRLVARLASDQRLPTILLVGALFALSWALLAAMAIRSAGTTPDFGPGVALVEKLPGMELPDLLERFFALCITPATAPWGPIGFLAQLLMWFLMSCAMMLPSAAPMFTTYCEIADTARRQGKTVVHPLFLVAGYLSVWFAASFVFAAVSLTWQSRIGGIAMMDRQMSWQLASLVLLLAGLYQFSGLKDACLRRCGNAFAVLFARWSDRNLGIYRLGSEYGLWCLGCCWALMLVMLVVGITNVLWMALLTLFTIVEKQSAKRVTTRIAGAILLAWAGALFLSSFL